MNTEYDSLVDHNEGNLFYERHTIEIHIEQIEQIILCAQGRNGQNKRSQMFVNVYS